MNYYNEYAAKPAAALRQLIADGLIPMGEVDDRSIKDVRASDLRGFTQCHFFAGIGGWSAALQLAGWPTDRSVWTASLPCQPFSGAGKGKGGGDDRHLWPDFFSIADELKPSKIYGEQVANAIPHGWIDRVFTDLESIDYACAAAIIPACGAGAPHLRNRIFFVADTELRGRDKGIGGNGCGEESAGGEYRQELNRYSFTDGDVADAISKRGCGRNSQWENAAHADTSGKNGFWSQHEWIECEDGKTRRIPTVESGIRLLAYGVPERVGLLAAGGNAIVPEVAARFIRATM